MIPRAPAEGNMARLCRLVKLYDRFDTQVFTFQIPTSILRDFSPDIISREFTYAHQKWFVSLVRSDHHVGAHIGLKNGTDGMTCRVDFSFTLLHPEHFTRNDSYIERGCSFTAEKPIQGRKTFVGVRDLRDRGFAQQENGEFLLELELRNGATDFEQTLQLPKETRNAYQHPRIETSYFTFGNFDWNLTIYPVGDSLQTSGRPLILLTRQTNFDHLCRLVYKITLGQGERCLESDSIEHIVDIAGHAPSYDIGYDIYSLTTNKCKLKMNLELISVTAISEVQICPLNRSRNRSHLYDRDKQAWMLESDISQEVLKFRMYYADVRNVPRKFLRHVCWNATLLPAQPCTTPCKLISAPFSNYYSQTDYSEEGYEMVSTVDVTQGMADGLLDSEGRLHIRVEWLDSHLLYNEKYQKTDELSSKHKHQMLREIMALQAENYALEKQLHSYQQTLAKHDITKPRDEGDGGIGIPNHYGY